MSAEIREFVYDCYGFQAEEISALEGYGGENYRIAGPEGQFVLKFHDPAEGPFVRDLLKAENLLQLRLKSRSAGVFPVPQKDLAGNKVGFSKSKNKFYRLLTFIEGELLALAKHTPELLCSLGKYLAEMDLHLLDFRHPAIEARKFSWDLQYLELTRKYIHLIKDPADRRLVEYFFLQFREQVEPELTGLRKSVIHGDANDYNVAVTNGVVSGIFDFGDISYTPLINELAIAVTYAVLGKKDPVKWALPVISGYHGVLPLEEKEIALVYYLIASRLAMSVCHSAKVKSKGEMTDYIAISEQPAWELLKKWIRINPLFAENQFRKAAGLNSILGNTEKKDLVRRHSHTSRALSLQFDPPIKMFRAAFQYMYDTRGNSYLDCYNNIPQVGHCHPRVVTAGQREMARLNTNTRYLNDVYDRYAASLLGKFPDSLTKVFFVNSGSAASDLAIRLALAHTNKRGIVVMEHGYHGNTRLGIEISHYKYDRTGGEGRSPAVLEAEIPDTYKGRFTQDDGTAGEHYARDLFDRINENSFRPAAFIAEPIVGCGGQVPLAKEYLKNVYPFIRKAGGVCISDEVQTGFGRLGRYFWGFEMQDVIPDIVILGKPIGNGHPLAAVVTTDEIAASFETGMEFFSSFGGNPVSCAIGQAVLDVLAEELLPENAEMVGAYLLKRLQDLTGQFEVCGDARGQGLFLGLELVKNKLTRVPNTRLAAFVKNRLREQGILVGTDGPFDNVLKLKPPICFTMENADQLVENLSLILKRSDDLLI